jgi:hypothetical protein
MTLSSISASPISSAPSKNSVTIRYSRSGVSSTSPFGRAVGRAAARSSRSVLVLHQTAHGLERRLVLQPAEEDRPAHLVPAVGADVVHRVELPEQVSVRIASDPQPQGSRSPGAAEADGLDVNHGDAELVLHSPADGLAAPAPDVEVRLLAALVRDREHLVRGEDPERVNHDRERERDADEHVEGVVHTQVEQGDHDDAADQHPDQLGDAAGAAGDDHGVDDPDARERHDRRRHRRQREAPPATDRRHVVRARALVDVDHQDAEDLDQEHAGEEREQVAPAPEHDHHHDERLGDDEHDPTRDRAIDRPEDVGEPLRAEAGEPAQDGGVDLIGDLARPRRQRRDDEPRDEGHHGDEPELPGPPDLPRQRGRCARRPAPTTGPARGRRDVRAGHLSARHVADDCLGVHLGGHWCSLGMMRASGQQLRRRYAAWPGNAMTVTIPPLIAATRPPLPRGRHSRALRWRRRSARAPRPSSGVGTRRR